MAVLWSQPFTASFPGCFPSLSQASNKPQSALYWLSFVWPAKGSWRSALPIVLRCLCRHTRSKGSILEIQQIITRSALRQARMPGLRGCYCKQMSYLNHGFLDQAVILSPWESRDCLDKMWIQRGDRKQSPSPHYLWYVFHLFPHLLIESFQMRPCFFAPGPSFSVSKSSFRHLKAFPPPLLFYHQLDFFSLGNLRLRAPAGVSWHSLTGGTGALPISSRQGSGSKTVEVPALLMLPLYRALAVQIGIFRGLFRC